MRPLRFLLLGLAALGLVLALPGAAHAQVPEASTGSTNSCYARNLGIYSNRWVWQARRPVLVRINRSLADSGPGACDPTPILIC